MNLTKNFTLEELTASSTAKRLKIDNTPSQKTVNYLQKLADLLQIIRNHYDKPITVGSAYRCEKLNKAVGGAVNSDHKYGCAADIHSLSDTLKDNKELYDLIVKLVNDGIIECRQIIWEYGNDNGPDWVHISINNEYNSNKKNQIVRIR